MRFMSQRMSPTIRGVTQKTEVRGDWLSRDTRSSVQKARDWLTDPANVFMTMILLAGMSIFLYGISDFLLLGAFGLFVWAMRQRETAPIKIPIQAKTLDPNEVQPGVRTAQVGKGIFFLGNDLNNGKEIWLTNDDARQHFLVFGTTGAGKALPDDERVLTAEQGWVPIRDVRVGDHVADPSGAWVMVVGVFPQGLRKVFELTFADGRRIQACGEHLWKTLGGVAGNIKRTHELSAILSAGGRVHVALPCPSPARRAVTVDLEELACSVKAAVRQVATGQADAPAAICDSDVVHRLRMLEEADIPRRVGFMDALLADPKGTLAGTLDVLEAIQRVAWSLGYYAELTRWSNREGLLSVRTEDLPGLELVKIREVGVASATCLMVGSRSHLFLAGDYVPTHNTELLLGFAANALSWGSGLLFCDGKGDVSLFAKMYALARRFGREDDLLVLNFMAQDQLTKRKEGRITSNSMNPFSTGAPDELVQMVTSLMDEAGNEGGMWKGRAIAMFTGVMSALVWLREEGMLELDISAIRDHLDLNKIIELADETVYKDMPQHVRTAVRSYLHSLPGFSEEKAKKRQPQHNTTNDQHGYLQMQFTRILSTLADTYSSIFATQHGEIDMMDVVLGRRILVIMLPALAKSPDEVANLGKIIVANLKSMMGLTLGAQIEGSKRNIVDRRPTNSPTPFLTILDEVGYYLVEGMAMMAAMARSLGFSLVFSSQDKAAMERRIAAEAESIEANTNTKIIMKIEEMAKTGKLAQDAAGSSKVARTAGYERDATGLSSGYMDQASATIETIDRVDTLDLKGQIAGEFTVLHGDKLPIRGQSFYADPFSALNANALYIQPNHFISVRRPSVEEMEHERMLPEIMARLLNPEHIAKMEAANAAEDPEESNPFYRLRHAFDVSRNAKCGEIERACSVFMVASETIEKTAAEHDRLVDDSLADERLVAPPRRDHAGGGMGQPKPIARPRQQPRTAPPTQFAPKNPEDTDKVSHGGVDQMGLMEKLQGDSEASVPHGVRVDDTNVDMTKEVVTQPVFNALRHLNYEPDQTEKSELSEKIEGLFENLEKTGEPEAASNVADAAKRPAQPTPTANDSAERVATTEEVMNASKGMTDFAKDLSAENEPEEQQRERAETEDLFTSFGQFTEEEDDPDEGY